MNTEPTNPAQSGPVQTLRESDWIEDYALENGKYLHICIDCEAQFIGHKRRKQCKTCANFVQPDEDDAEDADPTPPQPAPEASSAVCEWTMCDDAGLDLQCGGHTDTWPSNKYPFCPGCGRKVSLKQPD